MEITYTIKQDNGTLQAKFNADTPKQLFADLADFISVFGVHVCGNCQGINSVPTHREIDGNHYYSKTCVDCGYSLRFGQNKGNKGTLFAKHKNEEGKYDDKKGWSLYSYSNLDNDSDEDTSIPQPKPVQKNGGFKPKSK